MSMGGRGQPLAYTFINKSTFSAVNGIPFCFKNDCKADIITMATTKKAIRTYPCTIDAQSPDHLTSVSV